MVESVDTRDLKSLGHCGCVGSSPTPSTTALTILSRDQEADGGRSFCSRESARKIRKARKARKIRKLRKLRKIRKNPESPENPEKTSGALRRVNKAAQPAVNKEALCAAVNKEAFCTDVNNFFKK